VQSLIYGTIFYGLGSFEWTAAKFLWFLFFMYFTLLYFTFYGMMTTAITPNHAVAPVIAAPFYTLWNLFSGFMIPRKVREKLPHHNLRFIAYQYQWFLVCIFRVVSFESLGKNLSFTR
jgi:hypothetical protein